MEKNKYVSRSHPELAPLLADKGLARNTESAESLIRVVVAVCVSVTHLLLQDTDLDVASVHLYTVVNKITGFRH